MHIKAIKTHAITTQGTDILAVLDAYLPALADRTIIVVTSKIVSLCESRVASKQSTSKAALIKREANQYIPGTENQYGFSLTITHNTLIASAGIDESNAAGDYVLWPRDPQASANAIRAYLAKRCANVGVIIADSKTTPLRRGVTGMALSHSGFASLNDYVGKPDIFGRKFTVAKANVADGLAAAAVVVMGEGSEQTPLATITDVPFVTFTNTNPREEELNELTITPDEDLYAALLAHAPWRRGQGR